jgi:hypothetical protein
VKVLKYLNFQCEISYLSISLEEEQAGLMELQNFVMQTTKIERLYWLVDVWIILIV